MTDEQIKTLANLRYIMPRTQFLMYLRSPEHAGVTLDEILASDERIHAGFDFTDQAMRAAAPPQMSPEELEERWNLLRETYMSMRQEGDDVPFDIKPERLTDLLLSANENKMRSTLTFLHQVHLMHVKRLFRTFTRRVMARQSRSDAIRKKVEQADGHIIYGLGQNTFNIRIANQTVDRQDEWRMIRQFQPAWGQSMVVDLQFLKYSYPRCLSSIYREIQFGIHRLKTLKGSFALYLCNFDPTCPKSQKIFKHFPKLREPHYPVVLTEKSYLELFPQKDLVYLSPDSKTDLKFNGDDVYIIGAQTSKSQDCPKTLSVAKKDGIRHARLPLRANIGMRAELNIDHVMAMMAELQYSGDWIYASRWIPSRFFRNRIKSMGRLEPRDEAVYKAHNELNPSTNEDNIPMGPLEYRKKFKSILEQELIHPGHTHESVDLTTIMQPKERMSTPIFRKTPNSKGGKTSSYASKVAIATIFGE
ncbi:hypothetical protein TCAL_07517 [Tigriopus californicus]|uniref:SAM-dependent MTase TRM10-type domain-containing protein n=1 Tax=Tigriopus californicus TaxID=6832 RepID=A0A553NXQ1_TIGCA|nr:mitochondrial ribonuclease P protein 1 homolog [Tigriopus californicus]TRY70209.1 hypothetical protein TCAL_07517 [Tigriopus californicus]|eukprot:TCALIF_07517-PA protein Name:"Similar to trmt10c Mitochondrial ribonuclease P protein 1 homolog (Drosophila melanogaster)" AED:0.16 eAED:0.16 QI:0/-1/0/1/-1/1/1/0/474